MFGLDQDFIYRILKFGTVGFFCFFIDFGLTYVFKEKLKFNKFTANTIGFLTSAVVNFTLNRMWTFESSSHDIEMQFVKFISIASFALILNSVIIYLLNVKIRFNFYISKLMAVFFVMFYNYSMNALFTFTDIVAK
ncbi:MAG: GtrA family protein [Chitinophagales bacterium]|jgi:putative flippase GtrA|nr:GtrA family protein [Sphingobacteriales bacterium]